MAKDDLTVPFPDDAGTEGALVATLLVVLACIGFGLVPFFARSLTEAGIAPVAVAFARFVTAAVVLSPALWVALRPATRTASLWNLVAGAAMGLGWSGYATALETVPVATAGVIYMSYPVFALVIWWVLLGEAPHRRSVLGAALVLVASAVSVGPQLDAGFDWRGGLLALAAPAGFGFALVVLTGKLQALTPVQRLAGGAGGAVLGLAPLMATLPAAAVFPQAASGWALMLGLAMLTALVPQLIYVSAAPRVGPARAATAGAIELPTMFVVGWLAFGETVGLAQWIAGALVVLAMVVTPARRIRRVALAIPPRQG